MKEIKISTVKGFVNIGETITLERYVNSIVNGAFKAEVENVRIYKSVGNLDKYEKTKNSLPAVIPHGVFRAKTDKMPLEYSQLLAIDIDYLNDQKIDPIVFKTELAKDPHVICAHLSCSGNGMVIIIKHSGDYRQHYETVAQIAKYIEYNYKVKVDKKVSKNISSLRFCSYDPAAVVNWNAKEFELIPQSEIEVIEDQIKFTNQKEKFEEGNRNQWMYQLACNCERMAVHKEELITYASRYLQSPGFNMPEIIQTVNSAYKKNLNQIVEEEVDADILEQPELEENGKTRNVGKLEKMKETANTALDFRGAPTFPAPLYDKLPEFLKEVVNTGEDDVEKSLALLTALVGFSSILPNVTLLYDQINYPNLFVMIIANAGEGKSKVSNVKKIFDPLHQKFVDDCSKQKEIYTAEKQKFEMCAECTEAPLSPDCKGLYVPEDITHAALIDKLGSKSQCSLLFSTEIDSLNRTSGNETFNKTDLYRKIFHHEPISYARRTGDAEKSILEPKLSILITGTPGAFEGMLKGAEDGTVSRFAYFGFGSDGFNWKSQQSAAKVKAAADINKLSQEVLKIYEFIKQRPVEFDFTEEQKIEFDAYFREKTSQLDEDKDQFYFASVKRHGLIFKRIAAVLTVLEANETNNTTNTLICSEKAFGACIDIIDTLLEHSKIVYAKLEKRPYIPLSDKIRELYQALPDEFSPRMGYNIAIDKMGLTERTVRNYYKRMIKTKTIIKVGDKYQKTKMTTFTPLPAVSVTVSQAIPPQEINLITNK